MAGPDDTVSASGAAAQVVSAETTAALERARRSVSALMGHTNSKFGLVEGHWKALADAVGDEDPTLQQFTPRVCISKKVWKVS